jgi:hypothetical protein
LKDDAKRRMFADILGESVAAHLVGGIGIFFVFTIHLHAAAYFSKRGWKLLSIQA